MRFYAGRLGQAVSAERLKPDARLPIVDDRARHTRSHSALSSRGNILIRRVRDSGECD